MNRILFTDTNGTNSYILPVNPNTGIFEDSTDYTLLETLDGAPVRSKASFDGRVRSLIWPYFPVSNSTFMGMVSVLKTYKGAEKKIDLKDVDAAFSYGSRYIRILDVKTDLQTGGDLRLNMQVDYVYTQSY
jgi:hypothetical protein